MTEAQWNEVEKVLLYIADARTRAARARTRLESEAAPAHTLQAVAEAEAELGELHRRLKQGTYFRVDSGSAQLAI